MARAERLRKPVDRVVARCFALGVNRVQRIIGDDAVNAPARAFASCRCRHAKAAERVDKEVLSVAISLELKRLIQRLAYLLVFLALDDLARALAVALRKRSLVGTEQRSPCGIDKPHPRSEGNGYNVALCVPWRDVDHKALDAILPKGLHHSTQRVDVIRFYQGHRRFDDIPELD